MSSVLLEHSPQVKFYTKLHPEPGVGNFRYRSLQCHFLTVICANSQFHYSCEKQYFISLFTAIPSPQKKGKSLSPRFFLSGGSGCTQAIFYSLAGVVLKICCKILRFPVERDTTQVSIHCTIASVNYTLVLTIREITRKEPWVFEIFLAMFISTWIVDISRWRVNVSRSKNWFPSHFLYKPDSCFMCTFLSCCIIFNKIMDFRWLWYIFT